MLIIIFEFTIFDILPHIRPPISPYKLILNHSILERTQIFFLNSLSTFPIHSSYDFQWRFSIIQKPQKYLLKFSQKFSLKFRSKSEIFDRISVHPIRSDQVFHKNVLNPIRSIQSSFFFGSIRLGQSDQVLF